jgi:hypothetical protein
MINQMFSAAAKVANEWSLAAFAIAVVGTVGLIFLHRKQAPRPVQLVIVSLLITVVILAALPLIARTYIEIYGVYRIRVTVEDPQGMPVNNAKVTSSIGGEPKEVDGGWEFDIPPGSRPRDGRLTLYAAITTAFLSGRTDAQLGGDYNRAAKIRLEHDRSAHIRGQVFDKRGFPVTGAQVNVAGYSPGISTGPSGQFDLPAFAADGEQVGLHVFKSKQGSVTEWEQAGGQPVTVTLGR